MTEGTDRELRELAVFRALAGAESARDRSPGMARVAWGMAVSIAAIFSPRAPERASTAYLAHPMWAKVTEPGSTDMHRTLLLCAQSLACAVTPLNAAELRVPGDHPTIQSAIDAASSGDLIIIGAGTYPGGISISGKAVTLTADSDATVTIDGGGSWGISATGIPAPGLRLVGLAVTRCAASPRGAALNAESSVIEIVDCDFSDNHVTGGADVHGGGAVFASTSSVRISDSRFIENSVVLVSNGYPFGFGGALMLDSCDVAVDRSVFQGNLVSTSVPGASWAEARAQGGAISARWSSGSVRDSRFVANRADSSVTGFGPLASAHGFALSLGSPSSQRFEVVGCRFSENSGLTTSNNAYYQGAGTSNATVAFGYESEQQASHVVRDCMFDGNRAIKAPQTNGAAIADIGCLWHARVDVTGCRFAGSFASPLTETLSGFGQWSGSVRALNNPGVPNSTIAASVFCALDCLAAGSEIIISDTSEHEQCCAGDIDPSRAVDGADLGLVLARWGEASVADPCDLNADGVVDGADLAELLESWGPCPR